VPTLLRDSRFVLEHYVGPAFIRLARTAEPLSSHREALRSLQACRAALGSLNPADLGILLDWRLSPPLSDAQHDELIGAADEFAAQFARKAVLLLTPHENGAVGALWTARGAVLFHDEEAALAHVVGS